MWDFTGAKVGKNIEKRTLSKEKYTIISCSENTATNTKRHRDYYKKMCCLRRKRNYFLGINVSQVWSS